MKRQIIFRGKSLYNNEWVYGDLVHISGGTIIITSQEEGPVLTDDCDHALEYRIDEFAPVDPDTVGQWTGLTDSKGRRIFEGDIVRWQRNDMLYAIVFWRGMFYASVEECNANLFGGFPLHTFTEDNFEDGFGCEIVGNTHDNPALLK